MPFASTRSSVHASRSVRRASTEHGNTQLDTSARFYPIILAIQAAHTTWIAVLAPFFTTTRSCVHASRSVSGASAEDGVTLQGASFCQRLRYLFSVTGHLEQLGDVYQRRQNKTRLSSESTGEVGLCALHTSVLLTYLAAPPLEGIAKSHNHVFYHRFPVSVRLPLFHVVTSSISVNIHALFFMHAKTFTHVILLACHGHRVEVPWFKSHIFILHKSHYHSA